MGKSNKILKSKSFQTLLNNAFNDSKPVSKYNPDIRKGVGENWKNPGTTNQKGNYFDLDKSDQEAKDLLKQHNEGGKWKKSDIFHFCLYWLFLFQVVEDLIIIRVHGFLLIYQI